MTDYHTRPVLSVRIDATLKEFAVAEGKRPGMTLGSVVDEALADLRAKREIVGYLIDGKLWHPSDVTIVSAAPEVTSGGAS
jgi:hypothetical protein